MNKRIILVEHYDEPTRDDRISTYLKNLGYEVDWRRPFMGESLKDVKSDVGGSVIYGGAQNVSDIERYSYLQDEVKWVRYCIKHDITLLGICLGAQLIAHCLGAETGPHADGWHEFGYYPVYATEFGRDWMPEKLIVTQAHHQHFSLPHGADLLASGDVFPNQAFCYGTRTFALQFHPEVTPQRFNRWQQAEWPNWQAPGVQTVEQQNQLMQQYDAVQEEWLFRFVERLFGDSSPTSKN